VHQDDTTGTAVQWLRLFFIFRLDEVVRGDLTQQRRPRMPCLCDIFQFPTFTSQWHLGVTWRSSSSDWVGEVRRSDPACAPQQYGRAFGIYFRFVGGSFVERWLCFVRWTCFCSVSKFRFKQERPTCLFPLVPGLPVLGVFMSSCYDGCDAKGHRRSLI